jgi:hypothetical protein
MSATFYPPSRPSSVGEVLDLAFRIFKVTLIRALPYGIGVVIGQQLCSLYKFGGVASGHTLLGNPILEGVAFVLGVGLVLLAWSSMLLCQRAIVEHRPTSLRAGLGAAVRRMPAFAAATALYFVVVGGDFALQWILPAAVLVEARVLFLVLSLYLAILLACVWPVVLFAGSGPLAALRQSARLVWGNWWRLAVIFTVGGVIVFVIAILLGVLIAAIISWLGVGLPVMTSVVFTEVANALGAVIVPFAGALLLATFGDLRVRKEGTDLQQRIAGLAAE